MQGYVATSLFGILSFMKAIERYRRAKGLTQTELAQKVGVSVKTVQSWERSALPRPRHLTRLSEVLGVEPLQLLDEMRQPTEA